MQALDQILGSSGMDVATLAARFGLNPDQAQTALGSLMPAVLGGFQKKAATDDLAPATDAVSDPARTDEDTGNRVLGHIFGGKDVSRQVADHAAGQTGLSSTVLKAMLPVVAAMVARHVATQGGDDAGMGAQGGLGGMLGSMLSGNAGGGGGGNPLDQILARMR
jgi:hypothetical protein